MSTDSVALLEERTEASGLRLASTATARKRLGGGRLAASHPEALWLAVERLTLGITASWPRAKPS